MGRILHKRELLETVAKKHGVSYKSVNEVLRYTIKFIDHLVNETDTTAINFPRVGTFYYSSQARNRMLHRVEKTLYSNGCMSAETLRRIRTSEKQFLRVLKFALDNVKSGAYYTKNNSRHFYKEMITSYRYGSRDIKYIEEVQEKVNSKII